jgi:hypothetical protein
MTRTRALVAVVAITFLSAVYANYRLYSFGGRLSSAQSQLSSVQGQVVASQKASTQTRITTVGQRCGLTGLILGVLVRVHDTQDAAPFQKSLKVCREQLALVKQINAKTPAPPKSH